MKKTISYILTAVIVICIAVSLYTIFQTPATPDPVKTTVTKNVKPAPTVIRVTTPDQAKAEVPKGFEVAELVVPELPSGENVALNKPVESGLHTDVYVPKNVNDGKVLTYWEGAAFPNTMKIDLQGTYKIKTAVVMLNPAVIWGPRTQTFEIQASTDGKNFTTVVPSTQYQFDPKTGNLVIIDIPVTDAAYVQFIFTQNSGTFEKGGQAAEICIYQQMYTYSFPDKLLLVFYGSGYLLLELAPYIVVGNLSMFGNLVHYYQVFSADSTEASFDYRRTTFADDADFLSFLNTIKGKSEQDFGVSLSPQDKIITLSTCDKG